MHQHEDYKSLKEVLFAQKKIKKMPLKLPYSNQKDCI